MTQPDRPLFSEESGALDAAYVKATLAGDGEAFGQLVAKYDRPAVSTAYRLLGNVDDAKEVAQEAFLKAFKSLERLKDPKRFGPWLLRIVSNLSLNTRRSRRWGSTITLDEQQGADEAIRSDGKPIVTALTPDRMAAGHEIAEALEAALDTLPDRQRLALTLFTIEGWAQKDIADMLECTVENVKWSVFQARKKLREQLGAMIAG